MNPSDESTVKLPERTTPAWVVELLISGVAVFAMLQLPGWLNERLMVLLPRFEEGWRGSLVVVFSYSMGAAVILAATFALQLLRAYWIALVGMHSVYPDGIHWERLRMGPIEREVMQRRDGDFAAMVERADNRASVVFATGVALAMILLVLTVLVMAVFAVAMAIATAFHQSVQPVGILVAGFAIVLGPATLHCLAALHPVMLDGKPAPGLRYAAGSDAQTERPALVAMIDVRALVAGRHELVVADASPAGGNPASSDPWVIPFWR